MEEHRRLSDRIKESFRAKIFLFFGGFVLVLWAVFSLVFAFHEAGEIKVNIAKQGETLASLLAYNARTAVFAENRKMLEEAVQGIMRQKNVIGVSIYTADNKELLNEQQMSKGAGVRGNAGAAVSRDAVEFKAPVIIESNPSPEALYFGTGQNRSEEKIIGYVKVVLDIGILRREIRAAFLRNGVVAMMIFFLGTFIIYLAVKKVTRPLDNLTRAASLFGKGEAIQKVPVESSDEIGKLALAFNEMTDNLKQREEENRELENQLRHSQKMEAVGTLTSGIAHDFNNILTAVINSGSLLQMKMAKDDPLRKYTSQILASSERAAGLIESLLAFSRKQIISLKPVKLNDVVRRFQQLMATLVSENIDLRITLTDKEPVVMADPVNIEQVLMNLVKNACDAMPGGGQLTISTESVEMDAGFQNLYGYGKPGQYARMSVVDTGSGIDPSISKRIFEPFFTTKGVGKGSGLGLAMVYGIIKQHNGYINCISEQGKGTAFDVYLPLIESSGELKDSIAQADLISGKGTILLAEDETVVREGVREILEGFGYKVIEASNGEDAVNKFIQNKDDVDLLLFDIVMPGKSGKEAYDEICRMKPGIKTLFISGYATAIADGNSILEKGINFIMKPVSPRELLKGVSEVLNK